MKFGSAQNSVREATSKGFVHDLCQVFSCPYKFKEKLDMYPIDNLKYPNQIEIDIPDTQCNIGGEDPKKSGGACIMCRRNNPHWVPEVDRLYDALEKIKFLLPHLKLIHIQGIAEPFFKDHIFNILEILEFEKYKDQITITTITNGTYLNKKNRKKFLSICPNSKLSVSIDAATPETYKKIRKIDGFDLITKNLKLYCAERNKEKQDAQCAFNINLLNVHETVKMVELTKELGVGSVQMWATAYSQENCIPILVNQSNWQIFEKAENKAKKRASELGVQFFLYYPLTANYKKELVQIKLI